MAIQIPKGDNLGWGMPQARRTVIQGGDDPVGRAIIGAGREVGRIAVKLSDEEEQKRRSLVKVGMANNALEYQKQLDATLKDASDKVNNGELQPEQARDYVDTAVSKIDRTKFMASGATEEDVAYQNQHYEKMNYNADRIALDIQEKGISTKAGSSMNQLINNFKESNVAPAQALEMLRSDDVKRTAALAWGIKSQEQLDNLARGYTFDYLQNQAIAASDKGDYKALKQLRADATNQDFYKDVLQSDDRVRLAHSASVGIDRIESKWKADQALAKQAANEQYNNLKDSLYWQMAKEGKRFDELDPKLTSQLKPVDYEFFLNRKNVKNSNPIAVEDISYRIKMGEDVDLTDTKIMKEVTASDINSLAKEKAKLKANPQDAERIQSRLTEFNAIALDSGVSKDDIKKPQFIKISNEMNQEIEDAKKKKGGTLTLQEERNIMLKNFAKVSVGKSMWLVNPKVNYYEAPYEARHNYKVESIDDIPADSRELIEKSFKGKGIARFTDQDIIDEYNTFLRSK